MYESIINEKINQAFELVKSDPNQILTIEWEYITAEMVEWVLRLYPKALIRMFWPGELTSSDRCRQTKIRKTLTDDILKYCYYQFNNKERVFLINNKLVDDILTPEMIEELLNEGCRITVFREFVNKTPKDYDIYYENIPKNAINDNIVNILLKSTYFDAIKIIPKEFLTRDICKKAISRKPKLIEYIPKEFLDYAMCFEAISNDSELIMFVPKELINYDLCAEAIRKKAQLIKIIPKEFNTEQMKKIAIDNDPRILGSFSEEEQTNEIVLYALNKNGIALGGLPIKKRSQNLCEIAIENNPKALRSVPQQFKTIDICKKAVICNPEVLKYVPDSLKTKDFMKEIEEANINIPKESQNYIKANQECYLINNNENDKFEQTNMQKNIDDISINNFENDKNEENTTEKEILTSLNVELKQLIEERNRIEAKINIVINEIQKKTIKNSEDQIKRSFSK